MIEINYHNIIHDDMKNGDGLRVTLFVSGCTHNCQGCFNPETHDFNSGIPFDDVAKKEIFEQLEKPWISGLSILGGEPMHPRNILTVSLLCQEVKERFPNKNIWLWTGFRFNYVKHHEIINYLDVVIDGKFVEGLKSPEYHWRGSYGQVLWRKKMVNG